MGSHEILTPQMAEIVEKKSRFIANCAHVTTEEEAMAYVASMKKKYYDARHNCWAFVVGDMTRSSDDGEPSGTAGRPILDVLTGREICDVVMVVTRYFGGVLLGTGGLVRAYSAAAAAGIDASTLIERRVGLPLSITTDYGNVGRIQHLIAERGLYLKDTVFDAEVKFICMVDPKDKDAITTLVTNETSATARLQWGEEEHYTI